MADRDTGTRTVSIAERKFGRPVAGKIFVSSQMRDNPLKAERDATIKTIRAMSPLVEPWAWEISALPGPYSSVSVCLGHARTSDGLVLLLAETLTPITRREYKAAKRAGAPCFVLIRQGDLQDGDAAKFVDKERRHSVTREFAGCSELKTLVRRSIMAYAMRAWRIEGHKRAKKLCRADR